MKKLFGNIYGLKADQIRRLKNFYRRRIPPEYIITPELLKDICKLSHEIRRQIGLLVNRTGKIIYLIVGEYNGLILPDTKEYRLAPGRLRGLRCIHTHLDDSKLTQDDLTDLVLLRLDLMVAVTLKSKDQPQKIHIGHILPKTKDIKPYQILQPLNPHEMDMGCLDLIRALEEELAQVRSYSPGMKKKERALLVSVTTDSKKSAKNSLEELKELANSSSISVLLTIIQQRTRLDSRFLMGLGKIQELGIFAMHEGATMIIFDQELRPGQMRSITDLIQLKIIDRTQLILDIFARRAQTREGKLQVELAQLKYLLPRLIVKNTAMSRLTGGIGGRGPGETKLEINRRRVRERIKRLEKELGKVRKHRRQQRAKRSKRKLPVISIVGYTNAGKSTLLNTLTKSNVFAESRLFATLDPSSRRLRFPRDIEVIITDTVGFIKDLPKDLMVAFRATLEELENADILLHIIDISNPRYKEHIRSVEKILTDLGLNRISTIQVLNKQDLISQDMANTLRRTLNGIAVSANDKSTLIPLINEMASQINKLRPVGVGIVVPNT